MGWPPFGIFMQFHQVPQTPGNPLPVCVLTIFGSTWYYLQFRHIPYNMAYGMAYIKEWRRWASDRTNRVSWPL